MSDSGTEEQRPPLDADGEEQPRHRLDPERAAEAAKRRAARRPPPQVIDTRRYQRVIGLIGLTLVVVISVAFLTTHGQGTYGVPAGQKLHYFAAPLATSTLKGDADLRPPCTEAKHDPRALNICLLAKRGPLVLAFFVTSSGGCVGAVNALQQVSKQYPPGKVSFAAVAVAAGQADTAKAVKAHHWTVPVAYDADGALQAAYGVAVCPILELVKRGGVVEQRLIGEHWGDAAALAARVKALVQSSGP